MNSAFTILCEKTAEVGERSDCGVKALTLCLSAPYEWVWYELVKKGRMRGRGTGIKLILDLVKECGYSSIERDGSWKTVADFEKARLAGTFLVLVRKGKHILCVKDGKAIDWTTGGKHKIMTVWEIIPQNPKADFIIPEIPKSAIYARD